MNVLFLVHVEEEFRKYFSENYVNDLFDAITSDLFDCIIVLESGLGFGTIDEIYDLYEHKERNIDIWEWSWGYLPSWFEPDEREFIIPAYGHEYTYIPLQFRETDWSQDRLYVGGGAAQECLADWEAVLEYYNLDYSRVPELVWGQLW